MPRRGTDVRSLHARRKTIAKAFAELRQRGFLALQRHTCCRSCGWHEVPDDQEHVVFYHEQDWHAGQLLIIRMSAITIASAAAGSASTELVPVGSPTCRQTPCTSGCAARLSGARRSRSATATGAARATAGRRAAPRGNASAGWAQCSPCYTEILDTKGYPPKRTR